MKKSFDMGRARTDNDVGPGRDGRPPAESRDSVRSVAKALEILKVIAGGGSQPVPLARIAQAMDMNKSTCVHLLNTMCEAKFVERVSFQEGYRVGPMCHYVTRFGRYQEKLVELCNPVMRWLARKTGHTVVLCELHGADRLILHHVAGDMEMMGEGLDLGECYEAATSRVLLANLPDRQRADTVRRWGLPGRGQWEGVTTPAELDAALDGIRRTECLYVRRMAGGLVVHAFAAPIRVQNTCVCALGVAPMHVRPQEDFLGEEERGQITANLIRAARELSRRASFETKAEPVKGMKKMAVDRYLTNQIKAAAVEVGMDLVGFAPVERWSKAPYLLTPMAIMPGSKSVIVCAMRLSDTWTEMGGEPNSQVLGPGGWVDHNSLLDRAAYRIAKLLEESGYKCVPIASSNIWRFRKFEGVDSTFTPDLSHIHAAAAAGLSQIGWNGLSITPEFGPRCRYVSVVTDAELDYTPMYEGENLCDMCMECVKACPSAALRTDFRDAGPRVAEIGGKIFKYANKNIWRCAWAEHFSLDLDSDRLNVPHVDEDVITQALDAGIVRGHERGVCQKVCVPKHLRSLEPSFGREEKRHVTMKSVNRKYADDMPTLRKLRDDMIAQAIGMGADIAAVGALDAGSVIGKAVLEEAPGMKSVLALGIRIPPEAKDAGRINSYSLEAYHYGCYYKLHHILIRVMNALEDAGYHAAPYTAELPALEASRRAARQADGQPDRKAADAGHDLAWKLAHAEYPRPGFDGVPAEGRDFKQMALHLAQAAGLGSAKGNLFVTDEFGPDVIVGAVVTEAALDPIPARAGLAWGGKKPMTGFRLKAHLMEMAMQNHTDAFGVAPAARFDGLVADLKANLDDSDFGLEIVDDNPGLHGLWKSRVVREDVKIRGPKDYMPEANSVIVLGENFPGHLVANSGEESTKQIGTYGYYVYQSVFELRFAAMALARELNAMGYKTLVTENLLGVGSKVDSPRGALPDERCGALEGFAAGFGEIGDSGALLIPGVGAHQRRIEIITDAEMPGDALYEGKALCKHCGNCASACPMAAIKGSFDVRVGERTVRVPRVCRNRCDWAKRYSLNREEGPAFIGATTHVPLADGVSPDAEMLAKGCEQKDKILKKRTVILEPCLKHCPAEQE